MTDSTAPQPAKVSVTIDDPLYTLLLEVRDDVRDVKHDVAELREDKVDHEERLRKLEERKFVSPWQMWLAVGSGVTFLGGILAIINQLSGAA